MGLLLNEMLIRIIIDNGDLHIAAFVETWCTSLPKWATDCTKY
jgi:hypothetical protein